MKLIEHTPEALAHAKHLYENTGMPIADIAKYLGIGTTTFYNRLRTAWRWKKRNRQLAELDAAAEAAARAGATEAVEEIREIAGPLMKTLEHESIVDRARSVVVTEMRKIEDVLKRVEGVHLRSTDAERAARTLASLMRTLRELTELERPGERAGEKSKEDEFRDLEEFRRDLTERLDRLRSRGEA